MWRKCSQPRIKCFLSCVPTQTTWCTLGSFCGLESHIICTGEGQFSTRKRGGEARRTHLPLRKTQKWRSKWLKFGERKYHTSASKGVARIRSVFNASLRYVRRAKNAFASRRNAIVKAWTGKVKRAVTSKRAAPATANFAKKLGHGRAWLKARLAKLPSVR